MENLREKAINIKGKDYVLVSDRILAFNEAYDKGDIKTSYEYLSELKMFIVKAEVISEKGTFTGMSQAVVGDGYINKTSALENAETSAVGRALGMMGIGVLDSVASADEINKASNNEIQDYGKKNVIPEMKSGLAKAVDINTKKKDIKLFIDINNPKKLESKEDYEEACKDQFGIELIPENYDKILDIINNK